MTASPIFIKGLEIGRPKRDWGRPGTPAQRRGARQSQRGRGYPPAQPQPQKPRLVESKPNLSKVKIFPLGVQVPGIAGAFTSSAVAQNMFQPTRGICQAELALDDIELTQLDVGNVSQLTNKTLRFPAQMFSPAADDVICDLDIVPPGITFSMEGVNEGAAAQRVIIGWYGDYFESVNLVR